MSCFVCFLYSFKAVLKIVSKFAEEVAVDETWDMVQVNDKKVERNPNAPRLEHLVEV